MSSYRIEGQRKHCRGLNEQYVSLQILTAKKEQPSVEIFPADFLLCLSYMAEAPPPFDQSWRSQPDLVSLSLQLLSASEVARWCACSHEARAIAIEHLNCARLATRQDVAALDTPLFAGVSDVAIRLHPSARLPTCILSEALPKALSGLSKLKNVFVLLDSKGADFLNDEDDLEHLYSGSQAEGLFWLQWWERNSVCEPWKPCRLDWVMGC